MSPEILSSSSIRGAVVGRRQLLAAAFAGVLMPLHAQTAGKAAPLNIQFRGMPFVHRWSKDGQHEFTPAAETDLAAWRDMVTLNVHEAVANGDQLAGVANQVLANYQRHGKILQTRSTPRTPDRPAQHLIVAVLGSPQFLEAAFARCMLHEGTGLVAVASHRVYGKAAGPEMGEWLKANGAQVEQALMAWSAMPAMASIKQLRTA